MTAKPFIKWVGGKRQLLPQLLAAAPRDFGTYFEPFLGGGALFWALAPKRAVISDANQRLVRTYRGVRDDVDRVISLLSSYPYERAFYEDMRGRNIDVEDDVHVAAWFIYLNRSGFNGLYRVNRAGRFNVPFGRHVNPTICDEPTLRACSAALQGVMIGSCDFDRVERVAERGDFVYFDCPYVPLTATSSFTSYTAEGFGAADQVRLRDVARRLARRGVHVLLSNSSAPLVRELYSEGDDFVLTEVDATRAVNRDAAKRGAVKEMLIASRSIADRAAFLTHEVAEEHRPETRTPR